MEVKREIVLDAPREEVWSALTEAEELERWFATDVELDAEEGGEGVFRWDDGDERRATVERVDPERAFEFTWGEEGGRVALTLEDVPGGTLLTVVESAPGPRACATDWSWGVELWAQTLSVSSSRRSPIRLAVA